MRFNHAARPIDGEVLILGADDDCPAIDKLLPYIGFLEANIGYCVTVDCDVALRLSSDKRIQAKMLHRMAIE